MENSIGTILGIIAVIAIFIVVIMGSIFPAIKDSGENMNQNITGTNTSYHHEIEESGMTIYQLS